MIESHDLTIKSTPTLYPVMEAFYTLQGEGYNTGTASYFVRLGGCPIGCHWCDVKESWDADAHPKQTVSDILEQALQYPGRQVVITGGEPAIYNLTPLTSAFKSAGFRVMIETSGAYTLQGEFDWVCISPKKFAKPLAETLREADELKVVIYNRHDFRWAEENAEGTSPGCKLYLQPEWSREKDVMPGIVDYVKDHPQWRVSLQSHKYMNIP